MHVHMSVDVHVCVCTHVCRPEVSLISSPGVTIHLVFCDKVSRWPAVGYQDLYLSPGVLPFSALQHWSRCVSLPQCGS